MMKRRRIDTAALSHPQTKPPAAAGENTVIIAHRQSPAEAGVAVGKPSTVLRSGSKIKALMGLVDGRTGGGNREGITPNLRKAP